MTQQKNYKLFTKLMANILIVSLLLESCTVRDNTVIYVKKCCKSENFRQISAGPSIVTSDLSIVEIVKDFAEKGTTVFSSVAANTGDQVLFKKYKQELPTTTSASYPILSKIKEEAGSLEKNNKWLHVDTKVSEYRIEKSINTQFRALCGGTYISKQGYKVEFYQEAEALKALVVEKEGALSKSHHMDVYIEEGFKVARLESMDAKGMARHIDANLAKPGQRGYVYIGRVGGLDGGGKRKLDKGKEKDEELSPAAKREKIEIEEVRLGSLPEEILYYALEYLSDEELNEYRLVNKRFNIVIKYILSNRFRNAINSNNSEGIKRLFALGMDPNTRYENGTTPLHVAAGRGNVDVIKLLIDSGADVHAKDSDGLNALYKAHKLGNKKAVDVLMRKYRAIYPLHEAIMNGDVAEIKRLLEIGADINFKDLRSNTPLYLAIKQVNKQLKKDLAASNFSLSDLKSSNSNSLVFKSLQAMKRNYNQVIKLLIEKGADVNIRNKRGHIPSCYYITPLHKAIMCENLEIIQELLKRGATLNPSLFDVHGSQTYGFYGMSSIPPMPPLCIAARKGKLAIFNFLIANGADINVLEPYTNNTILHCAVKGGNLELVKQLLNQKTNLVLKSRSGRIPLHIAAKKGRLDLCELLFEAKPSMNYINYIGLKNISSMQLSEEGINQENPNELNLEDYRDFENNTLLHFASMGGNAKLVDLVLELESDFDILNDKRQTPLRIAIEKGHVEVIKLLLEAKAAFDIEYEEEEEYEEQEEAMFVPSCKRVDNVLHIAAKRGNAELFNLIWEKLNEILDGNKDELQDILNQNGKLDTPPLCMAIQNNNLEAVKFLLARGANVNPKLRYYFYNRYSLLHFAIDHASSHEIIEVLIQQGADVNAPADEGKTPLHILCEVMGSISLSDTKDWNWDDQQVKIANLLIQGGANVNAMDLEGLTPLHYAFVKNKPKLARVFLENGAIIKFSNNSALLPSLGLNPKNIERYSLPDLIYGPYDPNGLGGSTFIEFDKKLELLDVALPYGADINSKDKYGYTLLHRSVKQFLKQKKRRERCLRFLNCVLTRGADINAKDNDGNSPLHLALKDVKENDGNFPTRGAVREVDVDLLNLQPNFSVFNENVRDNYVNFPLHFAFGGFGLTFKNLLPSSRGVDKKAKGNDDNFPPFPTRDVVREVDVELVKVLLAQGADVNTKDNDGNSPLHLAVGYFNSYLSNPNLIDVINLLVNKGADVNIKNKRGQSPLDIALQKSNQEIVRILNRNNS
jgi:ankyrin repeat protein